MNYPKCIASVNSKIRTNKIYLLLDVKINTLIESLTIINTISI